MVKTCCRSFPATAFQPDIQPAAICKDEADFQPDNVGAAYCDTYDPDRFPDRASCEADGFSWVEVTCEQMRKQWDSRIHVAFSEASKQHMCEHFRRDGTRWQSPADTAAPPGQRLPQGPPENDAKNEADFQPAK